MKKTIYEKLENNTFYSPDGCWIWTGAVNYQGGYGRLVHNFIRGVHRISFTLFKGPIPPGKFVCHTCDNPICYNPDHLWLGTNAENMADKIKKGRDKTGEDHPMAKITESQAKNVKGLLSIGLKPKLISKCRNISLRTIYGISSGKTWRQINMP